MNTTEDFDQMRSITHRMIDEQLKELQATCSKYEDIAEFVKLITFPMFHSEERSDQSVEYRIGQALGSFMYDLVQYDFISAITNPFHFQSDWVYQLNMFIGNFFLDDAYFTVERKGSWKVWSVKPSDGEFATQNPQVLIEAAKDIANFYNIENRYRSGEITPDEYRQALLNGMPTSGKVEELLNDR